MNNIKSKTYLAWAIYIIAGIVHLWAMIAANNSIAEYTKYLLMPILILIVLFRPRYNFLLLFALLFSWFGDVLLAQQKHGAQFFIYGLIGFLIAHIFYIALNLSLSKGHKLSLSQLALLLPMLLWSAYMLSKVNETAPQYFAPVCAYSCALFGLYYSGLKSWNAINRPRFLVLFSGIILFITSDSMIAINKFIGTFENAGLAIMITYIMAQALIVISFDMEADKKEV